MVWLVTTSFHGVLGSQANDRMNTARQPRFGTSQPPCCFWGTLGARRRGGAAVRGVYEDGGVLAKKICAENMGVVRGRAFTSPMSSIRFPGPERSTRIPFSFRDDHLFRPAPGGDESARSSRADRHAVTCLAACMFSATTRTAKHIKSISRISLIFSCRQILG